MTVSLRTPSRSGSARKLGASTMVKSGAKPGEVRGGRHPEQVAAEDARPGGLGVGAHRAPPARVGADVAVAHEQLALGEVVDHALPQGVVALLADGPVEAAPPDPLVGVGRIDEVLVLGRAAGVLARSAPAADRRAR